MTCALGYESIYPIGCNISQWGEGCEQCVSWFHGSWMPVIYLVAGCVVVLLIIISLLYIIKKYTNGVVVE